jgi:hypothetical protein
MTMVYGDWVLYAVRARIIRHIYSSKIVPTTDSTIPQAEGSFRPPDAIARRLRI